MDSHVAGVRAGPPVSGAWLLGPAGLRNSAFPVHGRPDPGTALWSPPPAG